MALDALKLSRCFLMIPKGPKASAPLLSVKDCPLISAVIQTRWLYSFGIRAPNHREPGALCNRQTALNGLLRHNALAANPTGDAMPKAILMMVLAIVTSSAAADWVMVVSSEDTPAYAAPATIRKVGDKAKMWTIHDFKAARVDTYGKSYRSAKIQDEYDCKQALARVLDFSFHSGNMGKGEEVYSDHIPDKWYPILPKSLGVRLSKFACGT